MDISRLKPRIVCSAIALAISALLGALSGCAGYIPGAKAYWDAKVKSLCEQDGGVRIFEKLHISKSDIDLLGTVGGEIGVPVKQLADPKAPAYEVVNTTYLRDWNPRISRIEGIVIRRADEATIARWVVYARAGGDLPTGMSEGTAFVCPDLKTIRLELQPMFVVEGGLS